MGELVLVVAKAPAPGRSKTRLTPPLTAAQAAALHEAMLLDTLDGCRAACADVRILHASVEDVGVLESIADGAPLVLQQGRGLGDALEGGIAAHVGEGPVAIVSSDIPGVPGGSLEAAFAALEAGADVVLGPAVDGGYWLVAMREGLHDAFHEIPWSTPAVLAVTRARCAESGLRLVELGLWRDVDTLVDLAVLAERLDDLPGRRTAAVIHALRDAIPPPPEVELLASELLSGSPWRAVVRDRLRIGGRDTEYGYLGVPRAVFVAAVTDDDELLLVRQYRHPVRDWTLEVPAGSVIDGETPLEAARRELREETGGEAREWAHLTTFYSSSAHLSLRSDAFLARGVIVGSPDADEDENLTSVRMPLGDAIARARLGGFSEGQTALTILLAAERLGHSEEGSER